MLQPAATVLMLWLLQANANAESASVNISPPWQMPCPLRNSARTGIDSRA